MAKGLFSLCDKKLQEKIDENDKQIMDCGFTVGKCLQSSDCPRCKLVVALEKRIKNKRTINNSIDEVEP